MPRYSYVIVFPVLIVLCIGINIQRYPAVSAMLQGKNLPSHCLGRAEFLETGESVSSQSSAYQTADSSVSQNTNSYNSMRSSRDPIPAPTPSVSPYSASSSEDLEYHHESYANENSSNFGEAKTSSQYDYNAYNTDSEYNTNSSYDYQNPVTNSESPGKYGDNSDAISNDYFYGEYAALQNKTEDGNHEEKMNLENDSSMSQNIPIPLTKSLSEPMYTFSSTADYSMTQKDNTNYSGETSENYRTENDTTDNADASQNKDHVYENYYQDKNATQQNSQDVSNDIYRDKTPESYRQPTVFREAAPQPGYSSHITAVETMPNAPESAKEQTKDNSIVVPNEKTLSTQEKLELRQSMQFVLQPLNSGKNYSANDYIPPDFLMSLDKQTKRLPVPTTELTTTIIPPDFEESQSTTDLQSENKENK
ncbi:MAG: hypothetical protein LBJ67_14320 [Planctomycetaceae bacterium]|jgi:hypothetical protein|nr:hypothetical protein [Planctomycetaceae bacterium]